MKLGKKLTLVFAAASMVFVLGACSNGTEDETNLNNLTVKYEADKEVDQVIISVDGVELLMEARHDDKKIKKGYENNVAADFNSNSPVGIKVMDDGNVIFEETKTLDLSEGKRAEVSIVDDGNGGVKAEY